MLSPGTDAANVSYESRAVCYVEAHRYRRDGTHECGPAVCTGFHWAVGDKLFLITNWHNVTGLRADTRQANGTFAPTHLELSFRENVRDIGSGTHITDLARMRAELYDDDDRPIWLEHPRIKNCDVVAIPADGYDWCGKVQPVNLKRQYENFQPQAGDDCFIVGYPEGFRGPLTTPIWKRASIATEPELSIEDTPIFLVDSATRPGMSGSPVFARFQGMWGRDNKPLQTGGSEAPILGSWTKFLGVYAGREGHERDGFQLGRVWQASVVNEIVQEGIFPANPHA
jgi:hypothetical protein